MDSGTAVRTITGALIWIGMLSFAGAGWWKQPESILLFGMLVVTPIAMHLIQKQGGQRSHLFNTGQYLQPFAALIAGGAYLIPPGVLAGTLAIAWLPATVLPAAAAVHNLRRRSNRTFEDRLADAALLYLPVSALFLWLERLAVQPDHLLLTAAIHFHFAGFGGLLLAGFAGGAARQANNRSSLILLKTISLPLLAAPLLMALPGNPDAFLSYSSLAIQLLGFVGLSLLLLLSAIRLQPPITARVLLLFSSGAALIASSASGAAAAGAVSRTYYLSSEAIIVFHGWSFAVGCIFAGLVGWALHQWDPETV